MGSDFLVSRPLEFEPFRFLMSRRDFGGRAARAAYTLQSISFHVLSDNDDTAAVVNVPRIKNSSPGIQS